MENIQHDLPPETQSDLLKQTTKVLKAKGFEKSISLFGNRDQPACNKYMQGRRTNSSCDYLHPPECAKNETKEGCKFGEKCFPKQNEDKNSQGKKQQKDTKPDMATSGLVENIETLGCIFSEHRTSA